MWGEDGCRCVSTALDRVRFASRHNLSVENFPIDPEIGSDPPTTLQHFSPFARRDDMRSLI